MTKTQKVKDPFTLYQKLFFCTCGFRACFIDRSKITGLSTLKKSLACERMEKTAKKNGMTILKSNATHCPKCNQKFPEPELYVEDLTA